VSPDDLVTQCHKVALVTGAGRGIGAATAVIPVDGGYLAR